MKRYLQPDLISDYPWYVRLILRLQKKKYGAPLDPSLIWGKAPRLLLAFSSFNAILNRKRSPLSPELRVLLSLLVAQKNHCQFCIDLNLLLSIKRHVCDKKVNALANYQESPHFSDKERLALEYTESICNKQNSLSHQLLPKLQEMFPENAVVELTTLVLVQNMSCMFNNTLQIPAQGLCQRLTPPK
ncbi:MAG: carboxymuconolactone decarboxylase family protein [Pseudomonadota bacterium]